MFNGCSLDQYLEEISSVRSRKLKAWECSFVFDQTWIHPQLHLRLRQNGNIWEERKVRITMSMLNVIVDNVISQIMLSSLNVIVDNVISQILLKLDNVKIR